MPLPLQGSSDEYTITHNEDASYTVQDTVEGRDGTDTRSGEDLLVLMGEQR